MGFVLLLGPFLFGRPVHVRFSNGLIQLWRSVLSRPLLGNEDLVLLCCFACRAQSACSSFSTGINGGVSSTITIIVASLLQAVPSLLADLGLCLCSFSAFPVELAYVYVLHKQLAVYQVSGFIFLTSCTYST